MKNNMIDAEYNEELDLGETSETHSPTPVVVREEMDFFDALKKVSENGKISKLEWNDVTIFGFLDEGRLKLHFNDGKVTDWIVSDGDLAGKDWILL